jgi:hypothetical protein
MRFGEASGRLDAEFNPFTDEFLGEILEAVALAWARMKQPKPSEIEDRITFRLAGRLINDLQFRHLPYDIVPQYWLLGMDGQRLGRLDLRFKHRQLQRDYFALESKRLHVTYPGGKFDSEHRHYTGDGGMGAFIEGQYSKGLPAAGMLGYVMDANVDAAWAGIDANIASNKNDLCLSSASSLTDSSLSHHVRNGLAGTRLGETFHDLQTHVLRIFHLLLPVKATNLQALMS